MNKVGSLGQAEKMRERIHVVGTRRKRQHADPEALKRQ